ncbi:DMT family transporter [Roseibium sp. RKSG952]|uniref:DMT family transporter n=1 Tax=Roseibium sp. RKSG952 TaxID=2529384 RepID=UPI0012BBE147|nr:DMT family transporter [Roseibium sp. RKSG952]MTH98126.1 DMT family transporter [Roseibium sp. RKSG952]
MSRLSANFLLLLAAAIWGSAFVAQSTAMDAVGPLTFTGIRFLIAALVIAPFALREHRLRPDAKLGTADWMSFAGIGVIFFFGIAIQQVGIVVTSVTNAAFLTAVYVVLVPLLGATVFRDRLHPILLPAACVTLAGIWLLGGGSLSALNWGDGAMLVCAVFWALHVGLIGRAGARTGRPLAIAFVQFLLTGLIGFGAGAAFEDITVSGLQAAWFEIFYTSVLSGCLAFTLQAVAQRWTQATDAAILLSSEALFGALAGALLLGERLGLAGLIGCGLILSSILAVQLVPLLPGKSGILRASRSV